MNKRLTSIRITVIVMMALFFAGFYARSSSADIDYFIHENYGGMWSDAEKSPSNPDDTMMCWAAAASNILDWTGWGYPTGMSFTGTDSMFHYYQDHWTNHGSNMWFAWEWWFNGTNQAQGYSGWSQVKEPGAGGDFYSPRYSFDDYFFYADDKTAIMGDIGTLLTTGVGVTLGIRGPSGHAITVWGFRYDEVAGEYKGIHITDSDDDKNLEDPPDMLRYYDVVYSGGKWYIQGLYNRNDYWLGEIYALDIAPFRDIGNANFDYLMDAIDVFSLSYTMEELQLLADLYVNQYDYPVEVKGLDWYFWPGTLPGDTGYSIGDSWEYEGQYFIKLGSGLGTGQPLGGSVPELPRGAGIVALLTGIYSIARRRDRAKT